jgi:hypothetical protein
MSNYLNEASPIVTVISGVSPNVFGAFFELVASTVRVSGWLWILYHGFPAGFGLGGQAQKLNIATGAAGLETVVMCKMGQHITSPFQNAPGGYYHGYSLPWTFGTGVRLSAQIADEDTTVAESYRVKIRLWEKPFP